MLSNVATDTRGRRERNVTPPELGPRAEVRQLPLDPGKRLPSSKRAIRGQVSRFEKAARLWIRREISRFDYALITADVVTRLSHGRPIRYGDRLGYSSFSAQAVGALSLAWGDPNAIDELRYGPLFEVPVLLSQRFPAYEGTGDQADEANQQFVWGDVCADRLAKANMRLRWFWRRVEQLDRWKSRQQDFAPNVHADLWKAMIAIAAGVVGFFVGRVT